MYVTEAKKKKQWKNLRIEVLKKGMIKPKITIHQEEKLSEEVSKYSNPYDKKVMVGIKKVKKANTWRKVEES